MNEKTWTLRELWEDELKAVPERPGIYRVWLPEGMEPVFTAAAPNPAVEPYAKERLEEKYQKNRGQRLLYIGKANGCTGLRQRLRQYLRYAYGDKKSISHRGGRAIWQIEHYDALLLTWEVCDNCEQAEHDLLAAYKAAHGDYPLANWKG